MTIFTERSRVAGQVGTSSYEYRREVGRSQSENYAKKDQKKGRIEHPQEQYKSGEDEHLDLVICNQNE